MSTLTEKIERDYPDARMNAATELPFVIDDRVAVTKREKRIIFSVCAIALLSTWILISLVFLRFGDIGKVSFMLFTIAAFYGSIRFFELLRLTYYVPLPMHDFVENGEERKHEVAVHGQTIPA